MDNNSDASLLQINECNLISQGKICYAHGGLLIYLNNKKLSYAILHNINNVSTIWERRFIEITLNVLNKKIILGNIYRPPHNNYNQFITELTPIVCRLDKCKRDVFIGGDFNIDLIKINEKPIFNEYLDMITSCNFFHKITLPTRLTENGGTLIDNFILECILVYTSS